MLLNLTTKIKDQILRRERNSGEFKVYKAALEWDLSDPIVIESRDDLKSERRWKDRIAPYHHQVTNLMTFCRRLPVTLLADDVGLGKTISAGLVISELAARARLSKVLIVAPKLLGPQWHEELGTKFGISSEVVIGQDLIHADPKEFGAVITTYNSARLYLDKIPADRFQMLILDEAHKLRNLFGVPNPPKVATTFKAALLERRFQYVLMLTATPIQNRLWDLYSLVDLLSTARGHENPFGSEGLFYRRFIADDRDKARVLKPEAKQEFRSVIYGYMSRVRRGDAKLHFPDRRVQMHRIKPSAGELSLIDAIAEPIQKLNRLVQISILQALASSPEALSAQLQNMARKGSVPAALASKVKGIVDFMPRPAKLQGLSLLIDRLRAENPEKWRLVIFTTRRETQTSIEIFLSSLGLKVGVINGDTGGRNQSTLAAFRSKPPKLNVIVSTEAGSEGVNMQVANVLVNYDLPWNPMVVEQRIGRIQRLGTEHASVGIFNVVLEGTFEEYIVGRLMEKLQLASNAIGDIESLLEASGIGDEDEGGMDDRIRKLVISALAGKDVKASVRMEIESIDRAKEELEKERQNIDALLGGMDGAEHAGPRAPSLPRPVRSMDPKAFVIAAYESLGGKVLEDSGERLIIEHDGTRERVLFGANQAVGMPGTNYEPGTSAFARLVSRIAAAGIHRVTDDASDAEERARDIGKAWVSAFGGKPKTLTITDGTRSFSGDALVRVRALVQHDSYERLITVPCKSSSHFRAGGRGMLMPVDAILQQAAEIGIDSNRLAQDAQRDDAIAEFCRFYLERRQIETRAAGADERKRHKLMEDFTPRLELSIAGLTGRVEKRGSLRVEYDLSGKHTYESQISVDLQRGIVTSAPELKACASSGRRVPVDCLANCEITGANVLRHLLVESEISGRLAQPEFTTRCAVSGKTILVDEAQRSDVTGALISRSLIRRSDISGKYAEPNMFGKCAFTNAVALTEELKRSEFSNRAYRIDQTLVSSVSGKSGHTSEFVTCYETRLPVALSEAEKCEVTGELVRPSILQACSITGKRVLPRLLGTCSVTGQVALRTLLVSSSVSGATILKTEGLQSNAGAYCLPSEGGFCVWSGVKSHPDDIGLCEYTRLPIHVSYLANVSVLSPLKEILDGVRHNTDALEKWEGIGAQLTAISGGRKYRIAVAHLSPSGHLLAARAECKSMLGLRTSHVGLLYSFDEDSVVGRLVSGKPTPNGWVQQRP